MGKAFAALILAVMCNCAPAGQFSYFCVVENTYLLNDSGAIEKNQNIRMRGERFSVDRQTGQVTGEHIPAFRANKFVVLHRGGSGNSFKSYYQADNFTGYLEIYEYRAGKMKGFVIHDGISILTGFCE